MALNLQKYNELKARGVLNVIRSGDIILLVARKFDADTGAEVQAEVTPIKMSDLDHNLQILEAQVEELKGVIEDLKKT